MGNENEYEEVWTYVKPTHPDAPDECFIMRFEYDQWVKVEPEALQLNDLIRVMDCKGYVSQTPEAKAEKFFILVKVMW